MNSQEQELFSSIYSPLEQLEELAINLRCTDGSIKCNLVAGQLMNMIGLLRDGLISIGVETIVDSDDWKSQANICFDSEKHRSTIPIKDIPEMVKPRTMGFMYRDDDGEKQLHPAKVYTEVRKIVIDNPDKALTRWKKHSSGHKVGGSTLEKKSKKVHRKGNSKR